MGKRRALTHLGYFQPLLLRTPSLHWRWTKLTELPRVPTAESFAQEWSWPPGSLVPAVLCNLESECYSALPFMEPELLTPCTLPSGPTSQRWPIITGAGPLLLYALSMCPKWGLPPTITRAGLLLCSLPPGAQPTVSMSHPWDHAAVDLWLPLDPKSQLHATTAGCLDASLQLGPESGLTVSPGGAAAARGLWSPVSTALGHPRAHMPLCFSALQPRARLRAESPRLSPRCWCPRRSSWAPRPSSAVVLCAPDSSPWLRCSSEHQCTRPDPRDPLS